MALTESQRSSWARTRAKGQRRVILEQWLAGAVIGAGGPTLRAFVRDGGWSAVRVLWAAHGALLIVIAAAVGGLLALVFGVLAWHRMERLYASEARLAQPIRAITAHSVAKWFSGSSRKVTGSGIFDSLEWTQWLLERDAFRSERALEALRSRLTVQDLCGLIAKCAGDDTEEQEAALRLLLHLARQRDPRLVADSENWGGWRRQLESLVQRHYPRLPLGPMALQGLMEADFDAAERYLAEGLRVDGLSRGDSEVVVRQLGALDSAIALSRLVEIAELGDERGLPAERVLESKGVVDRKRMAVIAADWRRRRDVATLRRVYHSFIDHLPEGTPIEDIIGLLGEPQRRAQNTIWYEAGGRSIYLEVDDRGRLGGRGLD